MVAHPTDPLYAARELDPDTDQPVQIVLDPAGSARGQVVDEDGQPIPEVNVRLWVGQELRYRMPSHPRLDKPLHNIEAQVGENGEWEVGNLLGGMEYGVGVYRPLVNRSPEFPTFVAKPGETIDLGRQVLLD
jgi:hypothetical protein